MDRRNKLMLIAGLVASVVFLFLFFVALAPLSIWVQLPVSIALALAAFLGALYSIPTKFLDNQGEAHTVELDESQTLAQLSALLPKLNVDVRTKLSALIYKASSIRCKLGQEGQIESWRDYIRPSLNIILRATKDFVGADQGNLIIACAYKDLLEKHSQQLGTLLERMDAEATSNMKAALERYQDSVEELGQIYNVGGTSI